MSSNNLPKQGTTEKKSMTGGFQLQTKIRLIIQEVLAATVRKLSLFGQKIQKFQDYFVTFRQRFETSERERIRQQEEMNKLSEIQTNIRREINYNEIKATEEKERNSILHKQYNDRFLQLEKSVKTLLRQNENINSDLSKTKSKFLQYSNTITTLKEQVSWKITKYLEETAESHTQMLVFSEGIKIENFNMNLMIEKQKEKYDHIILKYEEDLVFRNQTMGKIDDLLHQNTTRLQQIGKLNTKIDQIQFSLLSKVKNSDLKFEQKLKDMDKNNSKLANIFKKIDNFNEVIDNLKEQIEQSKQKLQVKSDETLKSANSKITEETNKIIRQQSKLQKALQKKIASAQQKTDKLQDFFVQKLQFVKMEIESDMANKTVKMLEQKSKTEKNLNNSTIEQINNKLSKMQLETSKSITKVQNSLKQQIVQAKREIQKVKIQVQAKIEQSGSHPHKRPVFTEGSGSGMSNQKADMLYGQINILKENIQSLSERMQAVEETKKIMQKSSADLKKKIEDAFIDNQQKLNTRVEKVMFLVTKMRGDSIIRNQFNDKEIKELKKSQGQYKERMETTWKLIPGMGECINLVLSLIFDAEYQHSKIIQDNLPLLAKDVQKFNTCCQGVIYEYRQKRKQGTICYRHSEIKKTDLVRAVFNGYIQLWEQIFEAQLKNKPQFLPKGFYKRLVQKTTKPGGKPASEKQINGGSANRLDQLGASNQFGSLQQMRSTNNIPEPNNRQEQPNPDSMNSSFHIRKKRTMILKQKERQQILAISEQHGKIRE